MTVRRVLAIFGLCAALHCAAYDGARDSMATARLEGRNISPVEGIWQIDGGATLLIAANAGQTDVLLLDGPDLTLAPFTLVGNATEIAPDGRECTLRLATETDANGCPADYKQFTATVRDVKGMPPVLDLQPGPYWTGKLWLSLNMYVSATVRRGGKQRSVRAVRIWPATTPSPSNPAVL